MREVSGALSPLAPTNMAKLSKVSLLSLVAVAWIATASCSLAFNLGQEQCNVDADCKGIAKNAAAVCISHVCSVPTATGTTSSSSGTGGANYGPGWGCIGNFKYPTEMGTTFDQKLVFVDALSQMPVSNLKVKLCGPLDSTCGTPTMLMSPDANGNLDVTVPNSPTGFYLDVTDDSSTSTSTTSSSSTGGGPGTCCDSNMMNCKPEPGPSSAYRESLIYLGSSAGGPTVLPTTTKTIRLVTNNGLCSIANLVKKTEDLSHGIAVVLTPNCNDLRSPGVLVDTPNVDAESQAVYFKNSIPNLMATETDMEGAVGWFNLPAPESATFTTRLLTPGCSANQMSCPPIGTATVYIRPAALTYVHVGPSP